MSCIIEYFSYNSMSLLAGEFINTTWSFYILVEENLGFYSLLVVKLRENQGLGKTLSRLKWLFYVFGLLTNQVGEGQKIWVETC